MSSYYGLSTKLATVPPVRQIDYAGAVVDAFVASPPITATSPTSIVTPFYSALADAYVAAPALVVESLTAIQVPLSSPFADAYVAAPALTLATPDDITLSLTPAIVDAYLGDLPLTLGVGEAITLELNRAYIDCYVEDVPLVTGGETFDTATLTPQYLDAYVAEPAVTVSVPGASTVALAPAIVDAYVASPTLSLGGLTSQTVTFNPATVDAYVAAPAITLGSPGASTVNFASPLVDAYVASPALVLETPDASTLAFTGGMIDAYVADPQITSSAPGAATVNQVEAFIDAFVANPAITAQAPGSITVPHTEPFVDAFVANPEVTIEDVGPPPNEAACQVAEGWMYSDPLSSYNLFDYNGYISIWFKSTNPTPDVGVHKQVIFQAMNATREDHVEVGVGRHGNTLYPDLYVSINDDRGTASTWTWLEEEENNQGRTVVDLYDGEWHHLVFGFEGDAVTNPSPQEWYWWIDGEQYGIDEFYVEDPGIEDWFRGVQENSPINFTELNVGFNHLVGPFPPTGPNQNENIYGCLDELLVVNTRTIGDRGATSGEVTDDVAYLYNQGLGRLVEQVESDNPNGLWDDVYNAWKFESNDIGNEYKNPTGTGTHNLPNNGNINSAAGIPGGGFVSISADFGSDLIVQNPTPHLYTPYAADGAMSHPNNAITIVLWFKPAAASPTPNDGTLYPALASQSGSGLGEWALYRRPNGDWVFDTRSTLGTRTALWTGTRTMDTSLWYMVAGTFTLSTASIYLWWYDGVPTYGNGSIAIGTVNRNTGSLFRLGTWSGGNHPSQGWIDDVLYFNEALPNLGNSQSLQWLFNDGAGRSIDNIKSNDITFYDRIASHWSLNETGNGTQGRSDDAAGLQSALRVYGSSVGLIVSGNIGTGPGHIVD